MEPAIPHADLPQTAWPLVAAAGLGNSQAVALLLATYRQPMITHLMARRRLSTADAEDLVQEFILDKIIATNIVALADRSHGRFRNFLLTSLDHFQSDASRAAHAAKRAPDRAGPIPDDARRTPAARNSAPDSTFEQEWAKVLIARTIERMRRHCDTPENLRIMAVFQTRILDPIMENKPPVSYDQFAASFQFASPLQAANALVTAKRMFRRLLRETIAEYASDDAIDQEIADLFAILSRLSA